MPVSSSNFKRGLIFCTCVVVFLWCAISLKSPVSTITSDKFNPNTPTPLESYPNAQDQKELTSPPPPKYAYATLLTAEGDIEFPDVEEPYLKAARLLTYQLLHNPATRGARTDIPFLILVTDDVPLKHREILAADGAIIVPAETLGAEWIHPKWDRWNDVLAKLNLWKQTGYDKITFLDADSVIFRPISDIFEIPATAPRETLPAAPETNGPMSQNTDLHLPATYVIAGIHDHWVEQFLPPVPGSEFYAPNNYMNAGFFVLSPSVELFNYYLLLMDKPGQFDSAYPEQNLLNCAHRTDARMPWQDLGNMWNQKGAVQADYEGGLKSIHHKWWRPIPDEFLAGKIKEAVDEMDNYFSTSTV